MNHEVIDRLAIIIFGAFFFIGFIFIGTYVQKERKNPLPKNNNLDDKPTDLPPDPIQKTEEKIEESAPHAFIELTGNIAENNDIMFKRDISLILSEESDEKTLEEYNYYLRWYYNEEGLCRGFPELYDELLFRGLIRNQYEET